MASRRRSQERGEEEASGTNMMTFESCSMLGRSQTRVANRRRGPHPAGLRAATHLIVVHVDGGEHDARHDQAVQCGRGPGAPRSTRIPGRGDAPDSAAPRAQRMPLRRMLKDFTRGALYQTMRPTSSVYREVPREGRGRPPPAARRSARLRSLLTRGGREGAANRAAVADGDNLLFSASLA